MSVWRPLYTRQCIELRTGLTRLHAAAEAAWQQSHGEIPADHCACTTLAYRLSDRTDGLCRTCLYVRMTLQQARQRRLLP